MPEGTARVCLVISTFRSDDAVLKILASLADLGDDLFFLTIVVDSLGSGKIPAEVAARGYRNVRYENRDRNLGSAGNLAERLRLAGETGAEFAYAINHDGVVDPTIVRKLLEVAQRQRQVGAVYPLRRMTTHGGRYDLTGKTALPLPFLGVAKPPSEPLTEVHWSSSNGALYNLDPIRAGLLPRDELWLGFEDMAFGWLLRENGYKQFIVSDAIVEDNYEFRRRGGVRVSDKPPWYAYYFARNFILVTQGKNRPASVKATAAARIALELGMITALRPQKLLRYKLFAQGLVDGLRGKTGKGPLP